MSHETVVDLDRVDAVLFDVDGVVTDSAVLHARAWKATFDDFLRRRAREVGAEAAPFNTTADYARFVGGRSRREGLRAFLASRGFQLADQNGPSGADADTLWSLAERKDAWFRAAVEDGRITAFPDAVALLHQLRQHGVATAAVSAARNSSWVLAKAGVSGLFDLSVDATVLDRRSLPGKPEPAVYVEAAHGLGVAPWRAVVIDDSLAGVEAGARGGFAVVIGVDRAGILATDLRRRGASVVVSTLRELALAGERRRVSPVRSWNMPRAS
ncbi:HAD family hydrolase [Phytoactinopolyspora limicola]|uniref:HAD family hydrolase n=1 Tax=Phytoactinopolyspora limicola TaxID=2715536 RepID=UPI001408E48A|nr:HAD-IA family hydrolase [Phytoactinopolyspora limicola]